MTYTELIAQKIREIGATAVMCRAAVLGLLTGAVFDEPIDRPVIIAALGLLIVGEVAHWTHLHFQRKYLR